MSYHEDQETLAEYQASDEHVRYCSAQSILYLVNVDSTIPRVTGTYVFLCKEDLVRLFSMLTRLMLFSHSTVTAS